METPLARDQAALLAELFGIEADFEVDIGKQREGLEKLLASPGADVLVAVAAGGGGAPCGMATMQEVVSTAEGGPAGVVEDVVVARAHRGRGLGPLLLRGVEAAAAARGIRRLQLLADTANDPALRFYAREGWERTQLVCLRKRV